MRKFKERVKENIEEAKRREANLLNKLMEGKGIPDEKLVRLIAPSQVHKYKEEVVKRLLEEFKEGIPDKKTIEEIKERFGEEVTKELVNKVIETLLVKINSEDWEERMEACAALGDLGVKSKKVINALVERLNDKREYTRVRKEAAEALGKLGAARKETKSTTDKLKKEGKFRKVIKTVIKALVKSVEENEKLIKVLVKRLKDENEKWDVKKAVAEALGKLEVANKKVINALVGRLKDEDEDVREAVVEALGKTAKKNNIENEIVERILPGINSTEWKERHGVCLALGELGVPSEEVINALVERLNDESEHPSVRKAAAEALGKIAKKNKMEEEIVERILPDINSTDWKERAGVCLALGELGGASEKVIDALVERLNDESEHPSVRKAAAKALGKLGVANKEVVNALVERLKDKNEEWYVKETAAKALGKLGVANRKIINALMERLKDKYEDYDVKEASETALEQLAEKTLKLEKE